MPLFDHVYPLVRGIREVLVLKDHFIEASLFLKKCHGELARKMNKAAIYKVFADPEKAIKEAERSPWRPFRFTSIIPESKEPVKPKNPIIKKTTKSG